MNEEKKHPIVFQIEYEGQAAYVDTEGLVVDGKRYDFGDARSLKMYVGRKEPWLSIWYATLILSCFLYVCVMLAGDSIAYGTRNGYKINEWQDTSRIINIVFTIILTTLDAFIIPHIYYLRLRPRSGERVVFLEGAPKEKLKDFIQAWKNARVTHDIATGTPRRTWWQS